MFYLLSPTASVLMGLFVAGYAALTGAKSAAKALLSSSDCGDCHYEKPFLELSVQPVSEGDTVRHAYKHKGKYMAWIENRRKKTGSTSRQKARRNSNGRCRTPSGHGP